MRILPVQQVHVTAECNKHDNSTLDNILKYNSNN